MTDQPALPNTREIARWDRWERLTAPVTVHLMADARLEPGEKVADVGCGGGRATFAAAEVVGESGSVVAFDVSRDALDTVKTRSAERGVTNVVTAQGDVQRDGIPGGPFDVVLNQFGLTFVSDLALTFRRMGEQLRPRGRCVFASWAGAERNPLLPVPLLAPFRQSAPDESPFTMADEQWTARLLRDAGFARVSSRTVEAVHTVPLDVVFDESMLTRAGVIGEALEHARRDINALLARYEVDGGLAVPLVFHVFSAVRP